MAVSPAQESWPGSRRPRRSPGPAVGAPGEAAGTASPGRRRSGAWTFPPLPCSSGARSSANRAIQPRHGCCRRRSAHAAGVSTARANAKATKPSPAQRRVAQTKPMPALAGLDKTWLPPPPRRSRGRTARYAPEPVRHVQSRFDVPDIRDGVETTDLHGNRAQGVGPEISSLSPNWSATMR